MPSIWDDGACAGLVARAGTLTTGHRARWGKFSVAGMLAHLNDATLMTLGELSIQPKAPPFLKIAPVRYLVIHVLPFPRSAPTAPELLVRCAAADLATEQATFATLIERLASAPTLAATHPAFGPMTRRDWGVLSHRHTDHHLRQFGV